MHTSSGVARITALIAAHARVRPRSVAQNTPIITAVAGIWNGQVLLTDIRGEECVLGHATSSSQYPLDRSLKSVMVTHSRKTRIQL